MTPPTIGALFAGYGGLELATVRALGAGAVSWVAEVEPGPARLLAQHHPDAANLGDVAAVDWHNVDRVDVLTGGSPCQDLSVAGPRTGMTAGTRSNLWVAMREAVAALRPTLVVWENVQGALTAPAASALESDPRLLDRTRRRPAEPVLRALGRVLGDLATLGYDASWHTLRASDVGAPHRRTRVVVAAVPQGAEAPRPARAPRFFPDDVALLGTPRAAEWKGCGPAGSKSHRHRLERDYLDAQVLELNARGIGFGPYTEAVDRWAQVTGRTAPAPTELRGDGAPRLSPAFVEWVMGLDEGHVTGRGLTWVEELKVLGNGVVPQQVAAGLSVALDSLTA